MRMTRLELECCKDCADMAIFITIFLSYMKRKNCQPRRSRPKKRYNSIIEIFSHECIMHNDRCAPIAQLVELLPLKEKVPGSNPGGGTKVAFWNQNARKDR